MKKILPLLVAFLLGGLFFFGVSRVVDSLSTWQTIQILKTGDRSHTADLRRSFGGIDVNFKIVLDGVEIYRSPDFAPDDSRSFREWITWDEKEKALVFIVADQVLFAYSLETKMPLLPQAFPTLVIPRSSLGDLGYEGDYSQHHRPPED